MLDVTKTNRAVVFGDGQNLFHAARGAFAYTFPNYDIKALAESVCQKQSWELKQTRFYTGVPKQEDNAVWHHFWVAKMANMGRQGVKVFSRPLRYRNQKIALPNGTQHIFRTGEEKGIDVRIAIDIIRMAHHGDYDIAVIFSQDQDLSEVAKELRVVAKEQNRWIKAVSVFPVSDSGKNNRGIDATDWIGIDKTTYDLCLEPRDYRLPK